MDGSMLGRKMASCNPPIKIILVEGVEFLCLDFLLPSVYTGERKNWVKLTHCLSVLLVRK